MAWLRPAACSGVAVAPFVAATVRSAVKVCVPSVGARLRSLRQFHTAVPVRAAAPASSTSVYFAVFFVCFFVVYSFVLVCAVISIASVTLVKRRAQCFDAVHLECVVVSLLCRCCRAARRISACRPCRRKGQGAGHVLCVAREAAGAGAAGGQSPAGAVGGHLRPQLDHVFVAAGGVGCRTGCSAAQSFPRGGIQAGPRRVRQL